MKGSDMTTNHASTLEGYPAETDEMPAVPYRVLHVDLACYTDAECKKEVTTARVVILMALDPDDPLQETDIVPVRLHYRAGQLVTWSLDNKKLWEVAWFHHPETGLIEKSWTFHVEFTGSIISDKAQRENADFLKEIEQKLAARGQDKLLH